LLIEALQALMAEAWRRLSAEALCEGGLYRCKKRDFMRYVYLLRSTSRSEQTYIGVTDDLMRRLQDHNSGDSPHTAKYRPWSLVTAVAFTDGAKATAFEQYLKSGSGRAFAAKHLW
jgi:predicted GIY-YIG superfamily endonuclease